MFTYWTINYATTLYASCTFTSVINQIILQDEWATRTPDYLVVTFKCAQQLCIYRNGLLKNLVEDLKPICNNLLLNALAQTKTKINVSNAQIVTVKN